MKIKRTEDEKREGMKTLSFERFKRRQCEKLGQMCFALCDLTVIDGSPAKVKCI